MPDQDLHIVVPAPECGHLFPPGAALVCAHLDGTVTVHVEAPARRGGQWAGLDLRGQWAVGIHHAARRALGGDGEVTVVEVDAAQLHHVGWYRPGEDHVLVADASRLGAWLGA